MTVSVTEFSARCLEIIREAERERKVIEITRRGVVVARLLPFETDLRTSAKPWERLRGSGTLLVVRPGQPSRSPFDVEGVDLGLKREEIVSAIHDSRRT
jgi:prevent-host-death family protein